MTQHAGDAFDNRQPEPKPLGLGLALGQTLEFLEYRLAHIRRNTGSGIAHFDLQALPAAPTTDQHATAGWGVADCIGKQILQDTAQQPAVRAHIAGRGHHPKFDISVFGQRFKLGPEGLEHIVDPEILNLRGDTPRVQFRNIEQPGQ